MRGWVGASLTGPEAHGTYPAIPKAVCGVIHLGLSDSLRHGCIWPHRAPHPLFCSQGWCHRGAKALGGTQPSGCGCKVLGASSRALHSPGNVSVTQAEKEQKSLWKKVTRKTIESSSWKILLRSSPTINPAVPL